MAHAVYTRDLGRSRSWRKATVRSLAQALLRYERITTTLPKAKETQRFTERLITLGKDKTLSARRRAIELLGDPALVARLFGEVSPRFATRLGGYTRILHGGHRAGDGASLAVVELVELAPDLKKPKAEKAKVAEAPKPKGKEVPEVPSKAPMPEAPPTKVSEKPKSERPQKPAKPEKLGKPERPKKEEAKPKGFLEGLRRFFKGRSKQ